MSKTINNMTVKFDFSGIIATAFTPFENDSSKGLNLSVIREYGEYYLVKGFTMVLINGTYGEGMSMTVEERIQVANTWAEAAKKTKQQLIVQVGGTNLQDVKKLAQHAESIKASAILCLPELYYKPKTVEELISYLKEVGEAAPKTPLIYYHSPDVTNVTLNMVEFFEKIENQIPSLVGIKFASTKLDDLTRILRVAGQFKIIVANNFIIPACVAMGIDTFMPTSINIVPELVKKVYHFAKEGNFTTALEHQMTLTTIMDKIMKASNGAVLSMMKAATSVTLPFKVGPTRKPMKSYETPEEKAQVYGLLKEILI